MDFNSLGLAISRTENFTARPTVLIKILRLYEENNASSRQLETIIEQDPALTAKVLRVATSSLYNVKSANNVGRALSFLGLNTLRSIAISLAYQEILSRKAVGAGFDRAVFGRHCLAVAVGAKAIGTMMDPSIADELYIAGLMHEVGILALDRFCPAKLCLAFKQAQHLQVPLHVTERNLLKYDHCEVGGLVAEKWKMPEVVQNAIRYHVDPDAEGKKSLATAIVIGANHLAHNCGFPAIAKIPVQYEGGIHFKELGLTQDQIEQIEATIVAEVALAEKSYGVAQAA
ncbi:MAG: HDOD domain-containing protein [Armatimonadetes bacterium]|nr:HDOD domain-containing protein [Armatimonadota bacterium]